MVFSLVSILSALVTIWRSKSAWSGSMVIYFSGQYVVDGLYVSVAIFTESGDGLRGGGREYN